MEAVDSPTAAPSVAAPVVAAPSIAATVAESTVMAPPVSAPAVDLPTVTTLPDDAETDIGSIGRKAGRGLGWGLLGNLAGKLVSFSTSLVMVRLLFPKDFGAFAVAEVAVALAVHVNDLGLIPAVVQWRGKIEDVAATATTIVFGFSTFIYGVFWFIAPWFARISGVPEAVPIIRILMITIVLDGFTSIRGAYLLRTFQQRRYVTASVVGLAANGVAAISLGLSGAGAVSLAVGQVAMSAAMGTLVMIWAGLPIRIGIDRAFARRLMLYGLPLTLGLLVESLLEQSDKVVVGHAAGAAILGFYLIAINISNWAPGFIGSAIRYVSLPGFSRLSEKDSETLSDGVQRVVPLLFLVIVPVAVLIGVLAAPTIVYLYGPDWLPAAEVLRFLMILMVIRMLTGLAMDILMSTGKTYWTVLFNGGWFIALVPAMWFGANVDGARGAAIAQAVIGVVVALPLTTFALHRAGVRVTPVAPRLVRPLLAGVASAAVTVGLLKVSGSHALVQLLVAGSMGFIVYVAIAVPRETLRAGIAAIRARRVAATAHE